MHEIAVSWMYSDRSVMISRTIYNHRFMVVARSEIRVWSRLVRSWFRPWCRFMLS